MCETQVVLQRKKCGKDCAFLHTTQKLGSHTTSFRVASKNESDGEKEGFKWRLKKDEARQTCSHNQLNDPIDAQY